MSTDNLDLDRMRRDAEEATYRAEPLADDVLALLDRIKELEAQRDAAVRDRAFQRGLRAQDAAEAEEAEARADRAEARLARVTDDSMAERIARALDPNAWWQESAEYPTMTRDEWEAAQDYALDQAARALATIRAAAADEQEAP